MFALATHHHMLHLPLLHQLIRQAGLKCRLKLERNSGVPLRTVQRYVKRTDRLPRQPAIRPLRLPQWLPTQPHSTQPARSLLSLQSPLAQHAATHQRQSLRLCPLPTCPKTPLLRTRKLPPFYSACLLTPPQAALRFRALSIHVKGFLEHARRLRLLAPCLKARPKHPLPRQLGYRPDPAPHLPPGQGQQPPAPTSASQATQQPLAPTSASRGRVNRLQKRGRRRRRAALIPSLIISECRRRAAALCRWYRATAGPSSRTCAGQASVWGIRDNVTKVDASGRAVCVVCVRVAATPRRA